jgi:hypothetical protein
MKLNTREGGERLAGVLTRAWIPKNCECDSKIFEKAKLNTQWKLAKMRLPHLPAKKSMGL